MFTERLSKHRDLKGVYLSLTLYLVNFKLLCVLRAYLNKCFKYSRNVFAFHKFDYLT